MKHPVTVEKTSTSPKEHRSSRSTTFRPPLSSPRHSLPRDLLGCVGGAMGALALCAALVVGGSPAAAATTTPKTEVKLLSPGAGKRRVLRYRWTAGKMYRMKITMHTRMRMKIFMPKQAPLPRDVNIPPLEMINEWRCRKVTKTGNAVITGKLISARPLKTPKANPRTLAALTRELGKLKGMAVRYVISSRGIIQKATLQHAPKMSPQFRQLAANIQNSLRQLVTPLPKEAVGKGGQWRVAAQLKRPVALHHITTYTLQTQRGAFVTLGVKVKQRANAPIRTVKTRGTTLRMKMKLQSQGTGRTTLKLTSLFVRSSLELFTNMKIKTLSPQINQRVHTTMSVKTYIRSNEKK